MLIFLSSLHEKNQIDVYIKKCDFTNCINCKMGGCYAATPLSNDFRLNFNKVIFLKNVQVLFVVTS